MTYRIRYKNMICGETFGNTITLQHFFFRAQCQWIMSQIQKNKFSSKKMRMLLSQLFFPKCSLSNNMYFESLIYILKLSMKSFSLLKKYGKLEV